MMGRFGYEALAIVGFFCGGAWEERRGLTNFMCCDHFPAATEQSDVPCECWLLAAYVHLRLHDYHSVDKAARKG